MDATPKPQAAPVPFSPIRRQLFEALNAELRHATANAVRAGSRVKPIADALRPNAGRRVLAALPAALVEEAEFDLDLATRPGA